MVLPYYKKHKNSTTQPMECFEQTRVIYDVLKKRGEELLKEVPLHRKIEIAQEILDKKQYKDVQDALEIKEILKDLKKQQEIENLYKDGMIPCEVLNETEVAEYTEVISQEAAVAETRFEELSETLKKQTITYLEQVKPLVYEMQKIQGAYQFFSHLNLTYPIQFGFSPGNMWRSEPQLPLYAYTVANQLTALGVQLNNLEERVKSF